MTGNMDTHGHLACPEARGLLEKMVADEALDELERSSLALHLEHCRKCSDLERLTFGLSFFAVDDNGDRETEVDDVILAIRRERDADRQRTIRWLSVAVAASLAAVTVLGLLAMPDSSETESLVASAQCRPSAPSEPAPGVFVVHCTGNALNTTVEDGAVQIVLDQGAVALFVDPQRPEKRPVVVGTPLGEVRVKGTLFSVRVDQEDTQVEVHRGTVEIVPKDASVYPVKGGFGTALSRRNTFAFAKKTDPLVDALPLPAATASLGEASPADLGDADRSIASIESGDGGIPDSAAVPVDSVVRSSHKRHGGFADAARRSTPSMNSLIQEARSCLIDKNWACAASRYRSVLKYHSRNPESAAVRISLAKIELRHLGRPESALNHYNAYLRIMPQGPLAEEALIGQAAAYRRLGLVSKERDTLRVFLNRYPQGALSGKARTRLKQLN